MLKLISDISVRQNGGQDGHQGIKSPISSLIYRLEFNFGVTYRLCGVKEFDKYVKNHHKVTRFTNWWIRWQREATVMALKCTSRLAEVWF